MIAKYSDPLVCWDAGHGGHDPGALGPHGLRESDVVLAVCLRAGEKLDRCGVKSMFTRTTDEFVSLSRRAEMANEAKATIYISVHANASDENPTAEGIETFTAGSVKGTKLAGCVQDHLLDAFPSSKDRGVKTEGFAVLRKTKMEAVLAELEFIHSEKGEAHFDDDAVLDLYADALVDAVLDYFGINKPAVRAIPKPEKVSVVAGVSGGELAAEMVETAADLEYQASKLRKLAEILKLGVQGSC